MYKRDARDAEHGGEGSEPETGSVTAGANHHAATETVGRAPRKVPKEGRTNSCLLLNAVQDVYLNDEVTVA